jgi:hypothetical protein
MRLIATIEDAAVVKKILNHLGLSTGEPEAQPARHLSEDRVLPCHCEDLPTSASDANAARRCTCLRGDRV